MAGVMGDSSSLGAILLFFAVGIIVSAISKMGD